jgi:hypothetical protein
MNKPARENKRATKKTLVVSISTIESGMAWNHNNYQAGAAAGCSAHILNIIEGNEYDLLLLLCNCEALSKITRETKEEAAMMNCIVERVTLVTLYGL